MLSSMLKMANYSEKSQTIHRGFFSRRVARSLGPHPASSTQQASWKSFMTDDNTPIELSWSWSAKRATPSVRYSVEPIGLSAGSPADPFNSRTSVELLGQTLPLAPSLDLSWYRYFMKALVVADGESDTVTAAAADMSQTFMAFDLLDDSMVVKYYFLPAQKALSLSKSKLELVEDAISGLAASENPFAESLSVVTDYIRSKDEFDRPELEIVAIDCVEPSQSRFKIYVRSKQTTFNSVLDMMTLGSRISPISAAARSSLEELWCAVFGLERNDTSLSSPLPEKDHRTSGLLYYFELKPGSRNVKSKVYLPARHYGQSDGQIARGLSGFLERRGKGLTGEVSYYDGLRTLWYVPASLHRSIILS